MPGMDDTSFSTIFPIMVFTRPQPAAAGDWLEHEHGPGYIALPAEHEVGIRARMLDDRGLRALVAEIKHLPALTYLNLSENRRISSAGLAVIKTLANLTELNLSSVDLTDEGLPQLVALPRLARLDLSYCNRITDRGLKALAGMRNLAYINLQGCVKVTHGGITRISRPNLTVHK